MKSNRLMKGILLLAPLVCSLAYAQTPSDLKRQELELEKGEINTHNAYVKVEGGGAVSKSSGVSPYRSKDFTASGATKFVIGHVEKDSSFGVAVGPEVKVNVRLDENNKKMRFIVDGKVISALDVQFLEGLPNKSRVDNFTESYTVLGNRLQASTERLTRLKTVLEKADEIYNDESSLDDLIVKNLQSGTHRVPFFYHNVYGREFKDFESNYQIPNFYVCDSSEFKGIVDASLIKKAKCFEFAKARYKRFLIEIKKDLSTILKMEIESEKLENKKLFDNLAEYKKFYDAEIEKYNKGKAYASLDVSLLNAGGLYKDLGDALYKFAGFKGSFARVSFDVDGKIENTPLQIGLCGILEALSLEVGKYQTKETKGLTTANVGFNGSLCGRIKMGPVVLTNTVSAETNFAARGEGSSEHLRHNAINNSARLAVQLKPSDKSMVEIGAGHSYTYEAIGDQKIGTHYVGGGVTVYAK